MEYYPAFTGSHSYGAINTKLYANPEDRFKKDNPVATIGSSGNGAMWRTWILYGDKELGFTEYNLRSHELVAYQIGDSEAIVVPPMHKSISDKVIEKLPGKYSSIGEVLEEIRGANSPKK